MPITKSTSLDQIIHDFVHSTDSRFEGKSKEERIKMAKGAFYSMHEKITFKSFINKLNEDSESQQSPQDLSDQADNLTDKARDAERRHEDNMESGGKGFEEEVQTAHSLAAEAHEKAHAAHAKSAVNALQYSLELHKENAKNRNIKKRYLDDIDDKVKDHINAATSHADAMGSHLFMAKSTWD